MGLSLFFVYYFNVYYFNSFFLRLIITCRLWSLSLSLSLSLSFIKWVLNELIKLLWSDKSVNAILLGSRPNLVGVYLGTNSRLTSFQGRCSFIWLINELIKRFWPNKPVNSLMGTIFPIGNVAVIVPSWNLQEPYQWQKWCPCKQSKSEVKDQSHRGQNQFCFDLLIPDNFNWITHIF